MMVRGTLNLDGLKMALQVEAADGWHQFDRNSARKVSDTELKKVYEAICSFSGHTSMPPAPRLLRLLVDATAALHNETSRAGGWRILGIRPKTGRRLLGVESNRITFAVWHTATSFGLGYSHLDDPDDYYEETTSLM